MDTDNQRMNPDNPSDPLVWDIFENVWVPLSYWKLVNECARGVSTSGTPIPSPSQ